VVVGTTSQIWLIFYCRFASIVKPKSFYDMHAEGAGNEEGKRVYFYNIDLQGRLFLEEIMPKNVTSCIKDTRFLDFFFRRLKRADEEQRDWMEATDTISAMEYPFVSPCGSQELNLVRPAAVPIVFHTLTEPVSENGTASSSKQLVFAGSMVEPFDEKNGIAISRKNGRLYHRLTTHSLNRRKGKSESNNNIDTEGQAYGLIRSSVAVALSDRIVPINDESSSEAYSDVGFETEAHGLVPIPWLPLESEPGPWAMPG